MNLVRISALSAAFLPAVVAAQTVAQPPSPPTAAEPCQPLSNIAGTIVAGPIVATPPSAVVASPPVAPSAATVVASPPVAPRAATVVAGPPVAPSAATTVHNPHVSLAPGAVVPHNAGPPAVAVVPRNEEPLPDHCPPTQTPENMAASWPLPELPAPKAQSKEEPNTLSESGEDWTSDPLTSHLFWHVLNSSNRNLYCAFKLPGPGETWQPWVKIAPAEDWGNKIPNQAAWFQCYHPVDQGIYPLIPGERYSLLPKESGDGIAFAQIKPANSP